MYDLAVTITDKQGNPIISGAQDFLYLEMSRRTNQVGAISILLPIGNQGGAGSYETILRDAGLIQTLESALNSVPCFWVYVQARHKNRDWFTLGCTKFLITRPALKCDANGEQAIVISGLDTVHLLNARSIPRVEDDNDPQVTKSGDTVDVMHEIFTEQFGPVGATINGTNYPRRDWITPGAGLAFATVANGTIFFGNGAAGFEPRLNVRGTLLDLMNEAADYSTAQGDPVFFDMVPTKSCTRAGERPGLPIEFITWEGQRGIDRAAGNAAGNAPVTLSPQNGNVGEFEIGPDFGNSWNVVAAFGEGTGAGRPQSLCINDTLVDSCLELGWWESIATDNEAVEQGEVDTFCQSHLEEGRSGGKVTVKIVQTESFKFGKVGSELCPDGSVLNYGSDADFGDKVTLAETRKDGTVFSVDMVIDGFRLKAEPKQCEMDLLMKVNPSE